MVRRSLGAFGKGSLLGRFSATDRVNRTAILAAVLWIVLVLSYAGGYFSGIEGSHGRGTAFLDAVFFLLALVLPLGLIGLATWLAAELARQRDAVAALVAASAPLAQALAETRSALSEAGPLTPREVERAMHAALAEVRAELARDLSAAMEERLAALTEGQRRLEKLLSSVPARPSGPVRTQTSARPAPAAKPAEPAPAQTASPGIATDPPEDLSFRDLRRAFDFPRDADDREGFDALRRALRHQNLAQMLQAAEDILNLLSQQGVYTDDLVHEPAPAQTWRDFAQGRRGPEMDAVLGIRDPKAVELVRGLMSADGVFRDTALFFQRRFARVFGEVAPTLDDPALVALADTRSGRAFMLCAQASGSLG